MYSFPLAPDPGEKIPEMVRPLSRFVSGMSSSVVTLRTTSSGRMNIPVRVRNTGTEWWSSAGKFPVTLSYKWFRAGQMLPYEGERTVLPGAVAPGSAASLGARRRANGTRNLYAADVAGSGGSSVVFIERQLVAGH